MQDVLTGRARTSLAASLLLGSALLPAVAQAFEANTWIVRAGASNVAPEASSDQLALNGSEQDFISAVGPAELDVDDNTQLGLTIEYMVTDTWGVEVLAATPFEHTASGKGVLNGLDVADVTHLPPTISVVHHFNPGSDFRPYVGLGVNYTVFFDEDLTGEADAAFVGLGLTGGDVDLEDSFGLAAQVGADYRISGNWWLNASVRYIDIGTTVDVKFDNGTRVSTDLDIDPFVYSIMVGYTF
tara:strand:+ start:42636 stop:43361 length:726 start_codon:yes stop_codon:yes gene_type:complete